MAITPTGIAFDQTAQCVICMQRKNLIVLSAGMKDTHGRQSYACDIHFRDIRDLILGWTIFIADQKSAGLHAYGIDGDEYGQLTLY